MSDEIFQCVIVNGGQAMDKLAAEGGAFVFGMIFDHIDEGLIEVVGQHGLLHAPDVRFQHTTKRMCIIPCFLIRQIHCKG